MSNLKKLLSLILLVFISKFGFSQGVTIPIDITQNDFLKTYKLILNKSDSDYRFTSNELDTVLFPKYGEYSIYWINSGTNKSSFVLPENVPSDYSSVTNFGYTDYNWQNTSHYSIQFKKNPKRIAIFKSKIQYNNTCISWEALYFKNIFDTYLYNDIYYFINEDSLANQDISKETKLLIIPSFMVKGTDNKYYIDSIFSATPNIKTRIDTFLSKGGMIYAEGNAAYFIEKLGYLQSNAVDFGNSVSADPVTNLLNLDVISSTNPVSFTGNPTSNTLYASSVPQVNLINAQVIANIQGGATPVVFVLKEAHANGGKIVCNTGLPTVGGVNEILNNSRQLEWTFNTILYAFAKNIDVTRSIYNDLNATITAGKNAVSYDRVDTFEVRIKLRNLSENTINAIEIKEKIRDYFNFQDVITSGLSYSFNNNKLTFTDISIPAFSEKNIVYRLKTPEPADSIHQNVDDYISFDNCIYASKNTTKYNDVQGVSSFSKYRNYTDIMFGADIVADADLNWKNFLGLYYQPFKVFMIMANKERTPAEETHYVQYIPKDVPFYWVDHSINIPILRTPGGKYVDVLKGSNDQNNPNFDMDSDGHPDAWLDTSSIYPKGYIMTEDSVYWLNPWEHLVSGDTIPVYEDIDHDGLRPQDTDGDGIVDIEEPGDKIRVWKVTWNINEVPGLQAYDPYCSYEIWVDPPDLVALSAGVGYASGTVPDTIADTFYPYTPDINTANLSDTTWSYWMERDSTGNVIWKQLIYQTINNYQGFTFIDTAAENYTLLPTDTCVGTVPQPNREFIAVLSLGGEEIDMYNPVPYKSLYSNIDYKTIFNEQKETPIRTTYSYYTPLPNPLQFVYLTNNYIIEDTLGNTVNFLPERGKANITFDIDAATEYSYYWIRNVGYDVDYNDPSQAIDGIEGLGDGVFGYMIYDIPKGLGGYKIELQKNPDGSYDTDAIVEVDGHNFQKWIDNPNTEDSVKIFEDEFQYHVYIPQLLIPPALDDDNFDGIDDWIDDRGDRFCSQTGYLHDAFMPQNGEDYPDYPVVPFQDDIYGMVDSGWYGGVDNTYGDDFFENLGKTHFKIHAVYQGQGREGPVDISKGAWLVVEEIFGGSPWTIFSHTLSGYAEGTDIKIESCANPYLVKYGIDTTYIKHTIQDINEPHSFNYFFNPFYVSNGYGEATITTYAGGKDPCSLIEPSVTMPAIIDPDYDHKTITLIPLADPLNPDLVNYPQDVQGSFLEVMIEVTNGTDDNWINTAITANIPPELGNTHVVMSYVAYPRPLVPSVADPVTGDVIHTGDQIGSFITGWRFNQPENEVLVKLGDTLNLLQPSRRAYFIKLLSIDESLAKGVYNIDFSLSGNKIHYNGTNNGNISYDVPALKFSIADKDDNGNVTEYEKLIIGKADINNINVNTTNNFKGLENIKWSLQDVNHTDFDGMQNTFPASYNGGVETIALASLNKFPKKDTSKFYILEQGEVNSFFTSGQVDITTNQQLNYTYNSNNDTANSGKITVFPIGPIIIIYKSIYSVNGEIADSINASELDCQQGLDIVVLIGATNLGNEIAVNTNLDIHYGSNFDLIADSLPTNCSLSGNNTIEAMLGSFIPGETKELFLYFNSKDFICDSVSDNSFFDMTLISDIDVSYQGQTSNTDFKYSDDNPLSYPAVIDFNLCSLTPDVYGITHGTNLKLTTKAQNRALLAKNVWLRIYSIENKDTVVIGEKIINDFNATSYDELITNYIIPNDACNAKFFTKIDDNENFNELCENNNIKILELPIFGLPVIFNISNYPNPFNDGTVFSYALSTEEIDNISIKIYTSEGKEVAEIKDCPHNLGENTISWDPNNLASGTYLYKIIATGSNIKEQEFTGEIIKTK